MFKEFLLVQVVARKKTQTRRTHGLEQVNENPNDWTFIEILYYPPNNNKFATFKKGNGFLAEKIINCKPKYQIGDICYLKENYAIAGTTTHHHIYQSDYNEQDRKQIKWKSKLMMPAVSARYKVKVTDIRVERLHYITEQDAIDEGIERHWRDSELWKDYLSDDSAAHLPKIAFFTLWQSINGKESWNKNPWVFVYTFELL